MVFCIPEAIVGQGVAVLPSSIPDAIAAASIWSDRDASTSVRSVIILTAVYADRFAHVRAALDVMVFGAAIRQFHAWQHASTVSSKLS